MQQIQSLYSQSFIKLNKVFCFVLIRCIVIEIILIFNMFQVLFIQFSVYMCVCLCVIIFVCAMSGLYKGIRVLKGNINLFFILFNKLQEGIVFFISSGFGVCVYCLGINRRLVGIFNIFLKQFYIFFLGVCFQ